MNNLINKIKPVLLLSGVMALIYSFDLLWQPKHEFAGRNAAFSLVELGAVLVLGSLGKLIWNKLAYVEWWSKESRVKDKLVIPFVFGVFLGLLMVGFDWIFRIGDMSVGWPTSIIFYLWGGISQEIITHLFLVSLIAWLVSLVVRRKKYKERFFWVGAVIVSAIGGLGVFRAFANPEIPLDSDVIFVPYLFGGLTVLVELAVLKIFKTKGLWSALMMRFGFYSIWHVIWPLIGY